MGTDWGVIGIAYAIRSDVYAERHIIQSISNSAPGQLSL